MDVYEDLSPEAGVGLFQLGGRLIPRSIITESTKSLVETLRDLNEKGAVISGITLNADGKPHLPNAVHPEWRRTGLSIVMGT